MRSSAHVRGVLVVAVAALVGLVGLSACANGGPGRGGDAGTGELTDLTWESQALEAIGFSSQDLVGAAPAAADQSTPKPSAKSPRDRRDAKFQRLRFAFGRNVLHGEAVVQTDEGMKTVVVQRGTVTAIDATSITVKSADGFTLTWTFGTPIHVIEHRTQVQPSAIAVGTTVGVAGERVSGNALARLIVVPGVKPGRSS